MSELHKFIFDGLPVRGMVVRLTEAWQEILRRRAGNTATGAYPPPVRELLGEMAAAGVLMQGNIKFNGALVLQIFGDGPIKVAVAEVQPDLSLRATATVVGEVPHAAALSQMVNVNNQGRCAITLDPKDRLPGQQAYQGVVPLFGDRREPLEKLSDVLEHYMLQSEQLDTTLVLAADEQVAAGLLIQRLPVQEPCRRHARQRGRDWPERALQPHRDPGQEPEEGGVADAGRGHHPAPAVLGRAGAALRAAGRRDRSALCLQLQPRTRRTHDPQPGGGGGRRHPGRARAHRGGLRFLRPAVPFRPGQIFTAPGAQPPVGPVVH